MFNFLFSSFNIFSFFLNFLRPQIGPILAMLGSARIGPDPDPDLHWIWASQTLGQSQSLKPCSYIIRVFQLNHMFFFLHDHLSITCIL